MGHDDPSTTRELRLGQLRRAGGERKAAKASASGDEERTHDRRAERAAYHSEKLAERERSEREE